MKRGRDAQDCINEAQRTKDIDLAKFLCGTMSSHLDRDQLCKLARRANISVGSHSTKGMICKRLAEVLQNKLIYTKKNKDDDILVQSQKQSDSLGSSKPILRTLGVSYDKKNFRWNKSVKEPVPDPTSKVERSKRKRKERKLQKKLEKLKRKSENEKNQ